MTYYREEYEPNNQRLSTDKGKDIKTKRQITLKLVFGTLTQFIAKDQYYWHTTDQQGNAYVGYCL